MYLLHSWFNFVYLLHSWFNFCIYSILDLTQKSALLNKQLRLVAFKLISKLVFLSIGLIKNELFEKTSWRKNTICSAHIPYKGRALRDASVQDPRDKISTKYLKKNFSILKTLIWTVEKRDILKRNWAEALDIYNYEFFFIK